jgi:hypothetical protein
MKYRTLAFAAIAAALNLSACDSHAPTHADIQSIRASAPVNLPIPGRARTYLFGYIFQGKNATVPTGNVRLAVVGHGDETCDAYASTHDTLVIENAINFACWAPTTGPSTEVVHFGEIERERAETGFSVGS